MNDVPAGPYLDSKVAELVLRWRPQTLLCDGPCGFWDDGSGHWRPLPCFSTDIAAAWLVVHHLTIRRYGFTLDCWGEGGPCFAKFNEGYREYKAEAPCQCEPEAICRAALLAVAG